MGWRAMKSTLFKTGIACIIAAIVGGGFKAFGIEIPLLQSVPRQLLLGIFGGILLILSFAVTADKIDRSSQNHLESSPYIQKRQPVNTKGYV